MRIFLSLSLGYFLGCISPSHILEKIKHVNIRNQGTKNLGATNTMIILGKGYGALVMILDLLKSFVAVKIAERLLPAMPSLWLLTGFSAVAGHVFPFYLKFKGGKGLASFGGVVLGYDAFTFLFLLVISVICMFLFKYGTAMPFSSSILFPFFVLIRKGDIPCFLISALLGGLIIFKHWENIKRARQGEDITVKEYIRRYIK